MMSIAIDKLRGYASWVLALVIGYAVSLALGVPDQPGFSASLLQQHNVALALVAVIVAMVASYAVAWVIAGRLNADLPLASAALSLVPFSMRAGPTFYVLKLSGQRGVYLTLAIETAILFALFVGLWFATSPLRKYAATPAIGPVDPKKLDDPTDDPTRDEPIDQKLLALLSQAIMMAFVVLLVARADARQQALFAVLLGSTAAAWCAHRFIPAGSAIFFWLGPAAVAIVGYLSGYFSGAPGIEIGDAQHYFAALARPLPVDYVSTGIAGAIWGFSMRREAQLAAARDKRKSRRNGRVGMRGAVQWGWGGVVM
ncbi:MAG: hypothetical protein QM770_04770 [Tepidisphaeraceae bacterium]